MKKITCYLLCFIMAISCITAYATDGEVSANEESKTVVSEMIALKILTDDSAQLNTDKFITRGQMIQYIINAKQLGGIKAFDTSEPFSDIPEYHTNYDAVYLARSEKIINGNGDGTFAPNNPITYEEAIKMLVCALGYAPMAEKKGGYPDGYVSVAEEIGLTEGLNIESGWFLKFNEVVNILNIALDIPVLEQITYGAEPEYKVMDGTDDTEKITLRINLAK